MYERLYGKTGILAIVGSGFTWAWFDALFMSALFPKASSVGWMSELATTLAFSLSIPFLIYALLQPRKVARLLTTRWGILITGLSGSLGSLSLIIASVTDNMPALVVGGMLCASALAFLTLGWGGVYAQRGTITATPYVAGGFACAIVFDLPLFFMVPQATSLFYAPFPLVSCLILNHIDPADRSFSSVLADDATPARDRRQGKRRYLRRVLGVNPAILLGYGFVMVGFGYLQHLISFSPATGAGQSYGTLVQTARGIVAVIVFLLILKDPRLSRTVYRVGLPLMIAGCMTLPFTLHEGVFPLSAAIIIAGYTAFDLFSWVIFSSIACTQSQDPLRTIAIMRCATGVGYATGAVLGMSTVGFDAGAWPFGAELTTFISYLVVIAAVLLLSSEEAFALTNGYFDYRTAVQAARARVGHGEAKDASDEEVETGATVWMDARFEELGLTSREAEVARLFAHGRTQRWIADYLCISENTVGTHLRRIYQKAGVHNRQQFLDVLAAQTSASHKTRDKSDRP